MIVDNALYRSGERVELGLSTDDLAGVRAQATAPEEFVWVGLHEPTSAELDAVAGLYGLHELAVEEVDGTTVFRQRAIYHPRGLLGQAYWWAVYPFHGIVFGGMQRNIARAAEAAACTRAGV